MNLCFLVGLFVIIPIIFIVILVTTNIRSNIANYEQVSLAFVVGTIFFFFFIFYVFAKFDALDDDLSAFNENIVYLKKVIMKYDPSLLCLLGETVEIYNPCFNGKQTLYPLYKIGERLIPKIKNPAEQTLTQTAISETISILNRKFGGKYVVQDYIWFINLVSFILLTILYLFESSIGLIGAIFGMILTWLPIIAIVIVYARNLTSASQKLCQLLEGLNVKHKSDS